MVKYRQKNSGLSKIVNAIIVDLPSPMNISVWWNFGSLLGLVLLIQIVTGMFLAMHYSADISLAFSSVSHIMRDINNGWIIRLIHANGASMFFACLYCHIARSIYYGSFMLKSTWYLGVIMLLMVMAAAFMGYILPWGQMSFWGATVITNLMTAIPYFGQSLVVWLWGGFSVDNPTLTRFFSLHFLVPIILTAMVGLHIFFLHSTGSNNPLGVNSNADKIPFHWYYSVKDIVGFFVMLVTLMTISCLYPCMFMEADNFIPANPMVTPTHIVPEWYFLFAYAILRSIPNKLGGVIALVASLSVLIFLPITHMNSFMSNAFIPVGKIYYWVFVMSFISLTIMGSMPVESPYILVTQFWSVLYFSSFLFSGIVRSIWMKLLD